ncbi:3HB-oligomer hydrolase (3HBOH) [Gilliamella apis SCGC AB-598-P17]|nr:3HB-oligomer hydrolase (3HBOH) [Gilliamella apis SCGC AB-598-P17]
MTLIIRNKKTLISLLFLPLVTIPNIGYTEQNNLYKPKLQWITIHSSNYYDGDSDDLVTAGIGFTPLSSMIQKFKFADPANPTTQELRRAKLNRFIDTKTGEGQLFGFKQKNLSPLFDGKIAGSEILATLKEENVGILLQIPVDFDKKKPCIVAVPASNYDGLYNAKDMQIRGLWGLKHNCAVVYNDKGLGNGIYDITNQQGFTIEGKIAKDNLLFNPKIKNREIFIENNPNRYAVKQLHSKQNPEHNWGKYILNSIEFALYEINDRFSATNTRDFNADNTLILIYGAEDGASAALKAGELDKNGIIDGIVAVNPQIQPNPDITSLSIQNKTSARSLKYNSIPDYATLAALYIPCAIPAIEPNKSDNYVPYALKYLYSQNRCNALKKAKLLTTGTPKEALDKLHDYGWRPEMEIQLPYFYYKESIAFPYQYISSYGRFDVTENMCDYSVASTQQDRLYNFGEVMPLKEVNFSEIWSLSNGHLPIWADKDVTAIDLVVNKDIVSPRRAWYSSSEIENQIDYGIKGAICLREKITEKRVIDGLKQVQATGNLNKIKTFIVHGQNNVKQLIDHTSRPYVALNSAVEGKESQLRYIEVENASYLDGKSPFDNTLLAIDYYGEDAIEWLWANLTNNTTLPESQIIRTKPRGGSIGQAPQATIENLVPITQKPDINNLIILEDKKIALP